MSASSRIVRNAAQTSSLMTSARAFPRTGPSSAYTAYLRRNTRNLPTHIPALAILIPRRGVSTDTHTSSGPPAGPPPGFNAEQAKKPLKDNNVIKAPSKEAAKLGEKPGIGLTPNDGPTAVPKTDATEAVSLSELAGAKEKGVKKKEEKKLTLMQKVKKEVLHYWDGTKLLATEVRISTRLAAKMMAGYELSRREHRQLQRTVQDIGRLVPFSVFILVPFAELLLPVALKLFPNLLPSTYEGQKSKDTKATNLRATRKEVSSFLRDTLKETGLPLSPANAQKEEFAEFFRKVRSTGETPTPSDVIKVCKIFKDDLTLDNLSRPQLVGMCRYMNLNTFGTDMMLRYQVRHRMRQIKRDDRAISYEGVDSLSVPELQVACQSRGIRSHGVSPGALRDELQSWLDLRLKYGVPSTLLVLSNAFMYAQQGVETDEFNTQIDALTGVLSSIPEELFHEIELEVHNAEGAATNKQRLEVLKEQQDLIEEENEQDEENKETGRATPRDDEDIDDKEEHRIEAGANEASADKQVNESVEASKEGEELQREEAEGTKKEADQKSSS
ncbi:LETM1-domain-containing protein [Venustampulla echinocandica]|uniref:LETM1-domain-containing protein n=1 Tax=Venustampulla echinocandica TaxID=2656787 RepID=A0A370TE65_9HELO|nr:LETM1-domain-containing protein [Venustampulla echinocandica]RDL32961.1 LETM1-domain-containing protein [Venustampulla echinocandica]